MNLTNGQTATSGPPARKIPHPSFYEKKNTPKLDFPPIQVLFKTPVSITEHPKINEWLTLVEKEMRVTLAKLLAESVTEVEIFGKATSIDPATYISWIDKYQV